MIQLTLLSSDFRPTSVSLLLHQRDVPPFISAILSEGCVARILGDDGTQTGRAPLCQPHTPPPGRLPCAASG